ncbi:efflux RND transporter periplasmic adaptor subunit [Dyella jiangningensis]|uniref:efflux RND transporter periplasmic adaptor subunit n=1 Tax=Dyella jiangningensis TaxID=1379159 RepID=UPI00241008CF|nr:efflux RND transporter periplasmic adaptor subunit [Dyella jiangningensis]MDG2536785.1 efflux RND transporter periplasmic adaptor subunit [Dyella jiangningensis]
MSMLVPIKPAAAPKRLLVVSAIVAALALSIGGVPRLAAHGTVARQTDALAVPTVAVVTPARAPAKQTLVLPGDVEAFQEANIYARTSGYLHRWYSDIGTRVKRGDLLADIDAPELDAELAQARSDAATASANYDIARVTAARWQEMLKDDAVSRQSSEENVSTMKAKQAMLAAAQANVGRLAQLQSFEKVTAPFDGVITVRNVDTGALIDAGNGGTPAALFRLAETDRLRVFVDVPQDQAADVVAGAEANLALPQYPGRSFTGTVARTSGAIDAGSRTLRVEVDMDNPDGAVLPGAYAQVSLPLSAAKPGLSLPANALLFRPAGVQVAVVDAKGAVQLRTVTLGRDFGARVEIRSGLQGNERVIVNPGDAVSPGQIVRIHADPANA